jgi:hypothetical protein
MKSMGIHDVEDRSEAVQPAEPRQPDWWHRDHPTFTALAGFFSGIAFLSLVPAAYVALTRLLVSDETAEALFPFVVVLLAVPIGLVITESTRRFGKYMLLGMLLCALVVAGVASVVVWAISRGEL